jgi:hypothetical protein
VSPIRKTTLRRTEDRKRAETILKSLSEGGIDVYEGYIELYSLWRSNNASVPELRPLFRIPGVDPGGALSVTDDFRTEVRSLAAQILPLISNPTPEAHDLPFSIK